MKNNKKRIILILILLVAFIIIKITKNDKITFKYSKKYGVVYNDERIKKGIYPIKSNYDISYTPNEEGLEIVYHNPANDIHLKKIMYIKPNVIFWSPKILEEMDVFFIKVDSTHTIKINSIYSHQLINNENPWGLSYIEFFEKEKHIITKQVGKKQIDSLLNKYSSSNN